MNPGSCHPKSLAGLGRVEPKISFIIIIRNLGGASDNIMLVENDVTIIFIAPLSQSYNSLLNNIISLIHS
jgi:hypothetical protein